jgi:hypothetical protein
MRLRPVVCSALDSIDFNLHLAVDLRQDTVAALIGFNDFETV